MKYWQEKLENNPTVQFPDSLAGELVVETAGFSFAYLKEVLYVPTAFTSASPVTTLHALAYPLWCS